MQKSDPPKLEDIAKLAKWGPLAEAEIEAAAADPDAKPMTAEELRTARHVPRTKTLPRALTLTYNRGRRPCPAHSPSHIIAVAPSSMAAPLYHIPLGTLRDWEQGRTEPDQPARAYLKVIARDPEGVRRALL